MVQATFAMGCFWKPEMLFRDVDGVTDAAVGYAGGHVEHPSYRQVCQGDTGHAEVVQIVFDPVQVGYEALLDVFWAHHDPTTRDRDIEAQGQGEGLDMDAQYRSAIFTHDDAQAETARVSRTRRQAQLSREIVTAIEPLETFYRAEDYHQRYLERTGSVCY